MVLGTKIWIFTEKYGNAWLEHWMNRSTISSSMAGSMSWSNSACSVARATSSWWPVTDEPNFVDPKIVIQMWNSWAVTSCIENSLSILFTIILACGYFTCKIFLISVIKNSSTSLVMMSLPRFLNFVDRNLKQRSRVVSSPVRIWLNIPVNVPLASNWKQRKVQHYWCKNTSKAKLTFAKVCSDMWTCCSSPASSTINSCAKISPILAVWSFESLHNCGKSLIACRRIYEINSRHTLNIITTLQPAI